MWSQTRQAVGPAHRTHLTVIIVIHTTIIAVWSFVKMNREDKAKQGEDCKACKEAKPPVKKEGSGRQEYRR